MGSFESIYWTGSSFFSPCINYIQPSSFPHSDIALGVSGSTIQYQVLQGKWQEQAPLTSLTQPCSALIPILLQQTLPFAPPPCPRRNRPDSRHPHRHQQPWKLHVPHCSNDTQRNKTRQPLLIDKAISCQSIRNIQALLKARMRRLHDDMHLNRLVS